MTLVRIIGAGLAGATVAHQLRPHGAVEVVEAQPSWGGQLQPARAAGVLYEPHGAHIFHTFDAEVWQLVTALVSMHPYSHVVKTQAFGRLLSWPPQLSELQTLAQWPVIRAELAERPRLPRAQNFERWCIDLMGETLFREFIDGYTRKQWGCDPAQLSATWAPKRIELRTDGYRPLFRDLYQGWPEGGYLTLIDALLRDVPVRMGHPVHWGHWDEISAGADAVVITAPLDQFFGESLGALPWRGVRTESRYFPHRNHVLPCGVVNMPDPDVAYTRAIETKWMSGQQATGTVVSYEYPGSPARHYPVDDVAGENRALQRRYEDLLASLPGPPRYTAGRLATYSYINMDQAMRQGINTARKVLVGIAEGSQPPARGVDRGPAPASGIQR